MGELRGKSHRDQLAAAVAAHPDWVGSVDEAERLVTEHTKENRMATDTQQGTYGRDDLVGVAAQLVARIAAESGEAEDTYDEIADEIVNAYVERHPGAFAKPPDVGPLIAKARALLPEKGTKFDAFNAERATAFATVAIAELLWVRR